METERRPALAANDEFVTDVLVIGAGMAGMSAAAFAASHGTRVLAVEKEREIGGSAVLSSGGLWAPASYAAFRELDPRGDGAIVRKVIELYDDAVWWIQSLGTDIGPPLPMDDLMGFPSTARILDILGHVRRCRSIVLEKGGWIVTGAEVHSLLREGGRVVGAVVSDRDGPVRVRATWTLIATGGFQGDAQLRAMCIGPHCRDLVTRSNPGSTGDGLRLARAAGALLDVATDQFYGHLIPYPLRRALEPRDYLRLVQLYSTRAVLLGRGGDRIGDESRSYYHNAAMVAAHADGRALLVADDRVRALDRSVASWRAQLDRPSEAAQAGGNVAEAATLPELERVVREWGYHGIASAVEQYNGDVTKNADVMGPPRACHRSPLNRPPMYAMEVQPAITMTFGGIKVDVASRVLSTTGDVVDGLLAAGVDVSVYHETYGGGLALALVTGLLAAETALGRSGELLTARD